VTEMEDITKNVLL